MCLVPLEANVLEERMYLFHNQCWIQDFPEGRQSQSRALTCYYRPQRSCGKVMFLHLSVILSMGGVSASVHAGIHTPSKPLLGRHPPGRQHTHTPGQTSPWADTPQADTFPDRHPPRKTPPPPPGHHCSGRYASCWNTFLCGIIFAENCMKMKKWTKGEEARGSRH